MKASPKNTIIISEGERSESLFIVLSGKVKVFLGDDTGALPIRGHHNRSVQAVPCQEPGSGPGTGQEPSEHLTHQDMTSCVGCSRKMVSRIMKDLRVGGYIKMDRDNIIVAKTRRAIGKPRASFDAVLMVNFHVLRRQSSRDCPHRPRYSGFVSMCSRNLSRGVNMKTQSKSAFVVSAIAALFAAAAFNVYGADQVRSAGPSDKPGRALDEDNVRSQGASNKHGRALDEGSVKAQGASNSKAGRAIDESAVKSGGASDKPGRAIEEGAVKAGGASKKPGRAVDEATVKTSKNRKTHNRAIEGGAVKSQGASDKTSRAVDQGNK